MGIKNWLKNVFLEQYELTVWFHNDFGPKTKRVFDLKAVNKLTPTHIVGKDLAGLKFEVKTTTPFDYQLRKIH